MPAERTAFISTVGVEALLKAGNIAQAEIYCQIGTSKQPDDPRYHHYLGVIAMTVHHPTLARQYFLQAAALGTRVEQAAGMPGRTRTRVRVPDRSCRAAIRSPLSSHQDLGIRLPE